MLYIEDGMLAQMLGFIELCQKCLKERKISPEDYYSLVHIKLDFIFSFLNDDNVRPSVKERLNGKLDKLFSNSCGLINEKKEAMREIS